MISRLLKLFNGGSDSPLDRQESAKPDVINTKIAQETSVPRKFWEDIATLQELFGEKFSTGLCINYTLQEALQILPRERQRVDSYDSLAKYLHNERGIELTIKSNKTR